MTVNRALILYLSPWNTLSWPTDMSKRLRDVMRGGLWSSFSVLGAGTCISAEPNDDAGQLKGRGAVGVARTPLQVNPASDSWSAESGISPTLAAPMLTLFTPPRTTDPGQLLNESAPKHGMAPATSPLSYRQLKPTHGPRFQGWYCKWVVWLNFSSWSMRNGSPPAVATVAPAPPIWGWKKRAATLEKTISAEKPWMSGTLTRPAYPGILELCHSMGNVIGVLPSTLKS